MDGRFIIGGQVRALREQAGLHRREVAAALGCSEGHWKNIEIETVPGRNQPSAVLTHRFLRLVSTALDRPVSIDEISRPAETRRKRAA